MKIKIMRGLIYGIIVWIWFDLILWAYFALVGACGSISELKDSL